MVLENFIVDAPIVWDRVGKKIFENPHVKQGRKMRVQITNAGMVEDLSEYTLALGWKHTVSGVDGLDVFEDGSEANVGIFEMAYTENLMTNLGNLKASLVLTSVEDMVVAESNDFYVKVDDSPFGADAEQGVGSFTRLAEILLNEESRIVAEVARVSAEETRVTDFNALVDSEIIAQNVATKLQAKEAEYLPRLVSTEQQLAEKADGTVFRSSGDAIQPNVIVGSDKNRVEAGYGGNTIAGGGTDEFHANVIGGDVDAIGNPAVTNYAKDATDTNSNLSTILGGYDNVVQGLANNASGHHNGIKHPANHSSIAGGVFNLLSWGMGQSIAGGQYNKIQSTSKATAGITDSSAIGGGINNLIDDSLQSVIGGGGSNQIKTGAINTIGGGGSNKIEGTTTAKNANTIGGGTGNVITNGTGNTIGGGYNNKSTAGSYSTIVGGNANEAASDYVTVLGSKGRAYAANQIATGFNVQFVSVGDAQKSENMKIKTTTDAVQTYVNTFLRAGSMAAVNIKVVARRTDVVGDYAVFMIKGAANVSAGSNGTLIGTPVVEKFATAGATAWTSSMAMSAAQVLCYVQGEAGKTINWVVHYEFVENLG